MIHQDAAHLLRTLIIEHGSVMHEDALNIILDELKGEMKANGKLILEREAVTRQRDELIQTMSTIPQFRGVVSDLALEQTLAVEAVKRIAAEQTKRLGG